MSRLRGGDLLNDHAIDDHAIDDHVERYGGIRPQRIEGPSPQDPPIKTIERADNARRHAPTPVELGCRDSDTMSPPLITETLTKATKAARVRLS